MKELGYFGYYEGVLKCDITNIILIFRAAGGIIWTWRL